MQGWLSLEDTWGACRAQNRPLCYLAALDQCFPVLVEPYECIFNVAEPNSTQCNRDVVSSAPPPPPFPLFNRPRQASIAAASSLNRVMEMQAVPNAEGQLIVVAGSPVSSPRCHGSPSLRYMHFLHCFAVSSRPVTKTRAANVAGTFGYSRVYVPERPIPRPSPFLSSELFALDLLFHRYGAPDAALWMIGDSVQASHSVPSFCTCRACSQLSFFPWGR